MISKKLFVVLQIPLMMVCLGCTCGCMHVYTESICIILLAYQLLVGMLSFWATPRVSHKWPSIYAMLKVENL